MALLGKILIWGAVALVALFAGWHAFLAVRGGALEREWGKPVDFATLELGWKPNQFLVAPPGATKAQPHAPAPVFAAPPEALRDALLSVIAAEPSATVLERSADGLAFTAVQRTRLMRFPDFIAIEIRPVEGGSTALVYSRSVFGVRDFDVNRMRVERWLAAAQARLGA